MSCELPVSTIANSCSPMRASRSDSRVCARSSSDADLRSCGFMASTWMHTTLTGQRCLRAAPPVDLVQRFALGELFEHDRKHGRELGHLHAEQRLCALGHAGTEHE